jgi:nucleoside-diphosphate-sugar epimerase
MKTVLILGANGRFGQAATQAFAAAGWRVLAQMRRAPVSPLPAGASALQNDLGDTAGLVAQAAGTSVVVHAVNPEYTRWDAEALPALRHGLKVAQALGARFMLPGNVYNHGQEMPALLTPGTAQNPSTSKGRIRVAMEVALQEQAALGLNSVVIRAGDFYGCGTGSWLDLAIVKDIARGKLVYPGPLDALHAWAYLPDLARAFVAVASAPVQPGFQSLNFAGHALTGRDFLAALQDAAQAQGLRPADGFKTGGMPWGVIRAVGMVYPLWRELARMSYLWRVPHALDGSALARAVGTLPSTPMQQALRAALADLGHGAQPIFPLSTPNNLTRSFT